jgi:hypothetical protein
MSDQTMTRITPPTEVIDAMYDVIEDHDLSNIQALAAFATIILHMVEATDQPGEMLDEALTMIRESVARHITH